MTNRDKILETFFDNIDELSNYDLARFISYGIDCDDCFVKDNCAKNKKPCSENLISWLEEFPEEKEK